jgi:hypothetical protein
MSKLLGTPFGLSLEILGIDNFSYDKIKKKLTFLCSCSKSSLVDRATIVNQVLLSSLWFFVLMWRGFKTNIRRIRGLLENYLWSDIKHVVCKTVFLSTNYCVKKCYGGLGLINLETTLSTLLSKWVIHVMKLGGWSCKPPNYSSLSIKFFSSNQMMESTSKPFMGHGPWT